MQTPPLRGGLIGCGYISTRHLRAWNQIADAKIVAVCDLDSAKAALAARQFSIPNVYDSVARMLEEQKLDFVDIATRPAGHLPLVRLACARRLHVLCQKPVADTVAEAREMTGLCRNAGVTFMVHENARFQAWFLQFRSLIESGELGELFYARLESRNRSTLPRPLFINQPYFREMTRLLVFEMGVHFLDTMRMLFGEASSVYARLARLGPDLAGEDNALLLLRFGRINGLLDMSWCSVPPGEQGISWCRVQVEGTEGTALLTTDGVLTLRRPDRPPQQWTFPADTIDQSFTTTQRHFIDCVRSGAEPQTSGEQTLRTMSLVEAAYRSAEQDAIIRLDSPD